MRLEPEVNQLNRSLRDRLSSVLRGGADIERGQSLYCADARTDLRELMARDGWVRGTGVVRGPREHRFISSWSITPIIDALESKASTTGKAEEGGESMSGDGERSRFHAPRQPRRTDRVQESTANTQTTILRDDVQSGQLGSTWALRRIYGNADDAATPNPGDQARGALVANLVHAVLEPPPAPRVQVVQESKKGKYGGHIATTDRFDAQGSCARVAGPREEWARGEHPLPGCHISGQNRHGSSGKSEPP